MILPSQFAGGARRLRLLLETVRRTACLPLLTRLAMPCSCALCGQTADSMLCPPCTVQYFGLRRQRCPVCAMPLPAPPENDGHHPPLRCGACLRKPPAFDATVVATDYMPPCDLLVQELKFSARLALAPLFARLLRDALLMEQAAMCVATSGMTSCVVDNATSRTAVSPATAPNAAASPGQSGRHRHALPDLLTCVPLSPGRLRQRGFNQTLEIARPLARLCGVPLAARLLTRRRDTLPQSGLTPDARRRNIAGAFALHADAAADSRLDGCHVGVVDDVITTGHTLDQIAIVLKSHGAVRVTNLVFARTLL